MVIIWWFIFDAWPSLQLRCISWRSLYSYLMLGLPCFLAVMEVHPENGSNPLDSSHRMAITLSECSHLILGLPCTLATVHRENGWSSLYSYLGIGFPCFLAVAHFLCCTEPLFKHAFGHSCAKARKLTQISSWPRSWPDLKYKRIQMCKNHLMLAWKLFKPRYLNADKLYWWWKKIFAKFHLNHLDYNDLFIKIWHIILF